MSVNKTGLVVVNYNDYQTTIDFVNSIKNFNIINKIVVIDNCSTDNSYNELKQVESDRVVVIKTIKNGGYGYGNNFGIKYLIKKYGLCNIIISNPDIIVTEQSIIRLINTLNSNDMYAVAAPVVTGELEYNRGWRLPTPLTDVFLNIILINRILRKKLIFYNDDYYKNEVVTVDCVSGSFFVVKSDVIEKIKYFDESIFLYYEENVLGYKLKKLNLLEVVDTKASVIHNHSISIDKSLKRITKYKILKESQMYYHKHYNKANFLEQFLLFFTNKSTLLIIFVYTLIFGDKKHKCKRKMIVND